MKSLLNRAIRLLAIRDYSEYELRRKLTTQSPFNKTTSSVIIPTSSHLDQVISYCQQQGWLNDQAYAEKFVIMRSEKGYGSQRIKLELKQRGISRDIIITALRDCGISWEEIACQLASRRFGDISSMAWKDKIKIQRYLVQRGFYQEEIQSIFERNVD